MDTEGAGSVDEELVVKINRKFLAFYALLFAMTFAITVFFTQSTLKERGYDLITILMICMCAVALLALSSSLAKACYSGDVIRINRDGFYSSFQNPQTIPWNMVKEVDYWEVFENLLLTFRFVSLKIDPNIRYKRNSISARFIFPGDFSKHSLKIHAQFLDQPPKKIFDVISHHLHVAREEAAQGRHHAIS
ncbi:MAG TPA: hypothetical protein VM689_20605 [Aliidongia sp.]|nr:hypothetical protein [Aliidongia sp.]